MNVSTTDFKAARRFVPSPRLVLVAYAGPEEDLHMTLSSMFLFFDTTYAELDTY